MLNEFISPVLLVINDSWRFRAGSIEKPSSEPVQYIFFVAVTVCVLTCFFCEFHTVVLAERVSRLMNRVEKQERAKENKGK